LNIDVVNDHLGVFAFSRSVVTRKVEAPHFAGFQSVSVDVVANNFTSSFVNLSVEKRLVSRKLLIFRVNLDLERIWGIIRDWNDCLRGHCLSSIFGLSVYENELIVLSIFVFKRLSFSLSSCLRINISKGILWDYDDIDVGILTSSLLN
jgi:hypothetical protein